MRLSTISSTISTLLLIGCAGGIGGGSAMQEIPKTQAPSMPEQASISGCLRTQRDLTVPWGLRRYWCGNDLRRDSLQVHNVKLLSSYIPVDRDALSASAQLSVTNPASTPPVMLASANIESNMVRYLSVNDATDTTLDTQPVESVLNQDPGSQTTFPHQAYVNFTRTHEAFDEEGFSQAKSLIPLAHEARRVTLLGLYEDDELTKVRPGPDPEERFSVGRSLSVRELWRAEGVDISKVMIKHHRKNRPGRHVEVKFYE